jgi:hypothetical protein
MCTSTSNIAAQCDDEYCTHGYIVGEIVFTDLKAATTCTEPIHTSALFSVKAE